MRITDEKLDEIIATNEVLRRHQSWAWAMTLEEGTSLLAEVKASRRRIAELEQANRDLERLRAEASRERQFVRVGKSAERWYRAKKALERQADTRENDPPESYFERYEMAEARLFAAVEDLKAAPDALRLEGMDNA